jgi:hypothetical protein
MVNSQGPPISPFLWFLHMADNNGRAQELASIIEAALALIGEDCYQPPWSCHTMDRLILVNPISILYSTRMTFHLGFPWIGILRTSTAMLVVTKKHLASQLAGGGPLCMGKYSARTTYIVNR